VIKDDGDGMNEEGLKNMLSLGHAISDVVSFSFLLFKNSNQREIIRTKHTIETRRSEKIWNRV